MILTVSDPDSTLAERSSPGPARSPLSQKPMARLGHVVDPFGHHWEIGHPLAS